MSEFEFIDEEVQKAARRPRGHNWLALCNPEESEEVRTFDLLSPRLIQLTEHPPPPNTATEQLEIPLRPIQNNNESSRTQTSARQTMEAIEFPNEPANTANLQIVAQDVPCSSQPPSSDVEKARDEPDLAGSPVAAEPTPDDTKLAVKRSASPIAAHTPPRRLRLDVPAADHPMEDVEFSVEQANAADLQTVAQDVQRRSQPPSPAARNAEDGTDLVDPSVAANPQATSRRRGRPPKTDTSHGTQAVPRVPNRRNPIPAINDNATDSNGSGGKRVSTRLTKSASKKNKADAETMALLEQVEKRGDEAHLAVRQDEKRGQYLITLVDLVKGDFVVEYKGATISRKEALKQERILDAKNDRTCTLFYYQDVKDGKTRAIDSSGGVGKARFVRQSKAEANLVAKVMDLNGTKVIFLAKCDISANLELFVDYGGTWQAAVKANPSAATAPEPTPDDANLAVPIVAPNDPGLHQPLSPAAESPVDVALDVPYSSQSHSSDAEKDETDLVDSPIDAAVFQAVVQDVPYSSQSHSSDAEKDETDLVDSPVAAVAAGSPIDAAVFQAVVQDVPRSSQPLSPEAAANANPSAATAPGPMPDDTKLAVKRSGSQIPAQTPPRRLRLDRLAADHPMEDVEFSVEQANAADLQTVALDVRHRSQPPSPAAGNAEEDEPDLANPPVAAKLQATSRPRGRPPKTDTSHGTQTVPRAPNRRNPIPAINDNASDSNGSGGKRVSTRLTESASKKDKAKMKRKNLLAQLEKKSDETHLQVCEDDSISGKRQFLKTLVPLAEREMVAIYQGADISRKEALELERILDAKNDPICTLFYYQDVKDGKTRAIDTSRSNGKAHIANQSKTNANVEAKVMDLNGTKVIFFAKFKIPANTELLVDYGGTWQAAVKANPSAATATEPTPDDANLAVQIVAQDAPRNSQSLSPDADAEDETDLADPPVAAVAADSPNVVQNDPDLRQALSPIAESPVDVALDVPCSSQSASSDAEKDETDLVNSPVAAVAAGSPIVTQNDPRLSEPLSPAADDTVSSRPFQSQRRANVHAVADAEDNPCCSQSSLAPDADNSEIGSALTDPSTVVADLQANSNFSRSWNSEKSRGEQAAAQVLTDQNPFPTIDEIETGSELHGELAIAGLPAELRIDDTGLEELPTVASDIPDVAQDDPGFHQPLSPAAELAVDDSELAASSTEEDNSGRTHPPIDAAVFQAMVQDVPCSSQSSSSDAEKDETDLADSPVDADAADSPAVTQKDPGLGEPFSSAAEPAVDDLEFAAPSTAVCSEPIHTPQRAPSAECEEDNTGFTNPSIIDDLDVLVQEDVPCSSQSPSSDAEKDETDLADSPVDADAADSPAVNQIPRRWNTPRIRKEETEKRAHAKLLRQFSEKADEKHLKVFEDESNPGKGQCLMTLVPLAKGDLVAEYRGPILSYSKAVELEKELEEKQDMRCYFLFFYDTKKQRKRVVDSTKSHGRARFVNHSKTGANVEAKVIEVDGETKVVFIATSDIAAGSEILLDYKDNRPSVIEANPFLKE